MVRWIEPLVVAVWREQRGELVHRRADCPSADAHTFRFTDSAAIQPNDKFAIQPVVIYQLQTDGNSANGTNKWPSFGGGPVFFFTDHLSLAFEAGFDHTSSGTQLYGGWLEKFIIAGRSAQGESFSAGQCRAHS